MSYGICPLSVVPVRRSANGRSELVSQLLFGELLEVLERKGQRWVLARCVWDNCIGWVRTRQIMEITPSEFERYSCRHAFVLDLMQPVLAEDHMLPVLLGAQLPDFDGMRLELGEKRYHFSGQAVFSDDIPDLHAFVQRIVRRYLYAPAQWGGRSPFGIDSAGLVQVVYKMAGFRLPREADEQVHCGTGVDFLEQSRAGDLAFFEAPNGKINHVGILLEDGRIIHAYGQVRIDPIDHFGIYQDALRDYTHRLRVVRRLLEHEPPAIQAPDAGLSEELQQNQAELFKSPE